MVGLRDEHRLEPAGPVAVGAEDLELVQLLHVERERALRAGTPLKRVAAAECEPRRLDRSVAPLRLDGSLDRVVDLAAGEDVWTSAETVEMSPTRKRARSIT